MNLAVVFPGQGSQQVKMLHDLVEQDQDTRALFEQAHSILGYDLRVVIDEQPEKLSLTQYTQPALFVCSYALWQKIKTHIRPKVLAGHSLGEYNALIASGVFDFASGLKLVQTRAQLMANSNQRKGAMAAVLGLDAHKIIEVCGEFDGKVSAANFNSIDQTVIAGEIGAVSSCSEKLKQVGAKRVIALSVSVASHCFLMQEAADELAQFMNDIPFNTPQIPVIHNVDCESYESADAIKNALKLQLSNSVYWHQTLEKFHHQYAIDTVVECGPGKVLSNLANKTGFFKTIHSVNNQDSLAAFLQAQK